MWIQSLQGNAINLALATRIVIQIWDRNKIAIYQPTKYEISNAKKNECTFSVEVPAGALDWAALRDREGYPNTVSYYGDDIISHTLATFDDYDDAKKFVSELVNKLNNENHSSD